MLDNKDHIIATWVYGKAAHEFVTIANLFYNGEEFRSEGDEYVELSNTPPTLLI